VREWFKTLLVSNAQLVPLRYGNTRFLTQLRTGFTITACGQTRMVNSIQSDVELTIDRPFTLGNREFLAATSSEAKVRVGTFHFISQFNHDS
jgi:hypothetical protein